jgi:hypothetical protein|tara:strand:+ start:3636 stop:3965 length:330 start_codon:yes stop_codon:yes gene_type:complete
MNYRNIKDLNNVILQNLSVNHCDYRAKAYISKPDVFCLGTAYNQVAAAARTSDQHSLCEANIKIFLESESFKNTLKRDKHSPFPHRYALKCRNKIVKRNQALPSKQETN